MTRGVRLYLVGSFVLVSLAGCGRGFFLRGARTVAGRGRDRMPEIRRGQGERRPGPDQPDFGPRRLRRRLSAQGRGARRKQRQLRFCRRDLRPPGASAISRAGRSRSRRRRPQTSTLSGHAMRQPGYGAPSNGPISLTAPGVAPRRRRNRSAARGHAGQPAIRGRIRMRRPIRRAIAIRALFGTPYAAPVRRSRPAAARARRKAIRSPPFGPVAVKPAATLACPIVSVLDRWLADSVQPAAHALVRRARGRDQADLRLFLPRHERQFAARIFPNTRSATRSISRPSRWPTAGASR